MTVEHLEETVRRWFDLMVAGDWDALEAMYTDDAEYVRPDGRSKGGRAIVEYLTGIHAAFPDRSVRIDSVLVGPSGATVEWTESGTHRGTYQGGLVGTVEATGKSFQMPVAEVFGFRGSQIVSQHRYYDVLSFSFQVGWLERFARILVPTPSSDGAAAGPAQALGSSVDLAIRRAKLGIGMAAARRKGR